MHPRGNLSGAGPVIIERRGGTIFGTPHPSWNIYIGPPVIQYTGNGPRGPPPPPHAKNFFDK